jgi:hypothetical protein
VRIAYLDAMGLDPSGNIAEAGSDFLVTASTAGSTRMVWS